jgi:pimeloyl-ACP methyl ester carboxylesterase
MLAQPVAADLSGFDRPTLLLAGSDDRLIPNAETFAIAQGLKNVETRVIERVAHVSSIQAPERVAEAVIAFLNSKKAG